MLTVHQNQLNVTEMQDSMTHIRTTLAIRELHIYRHSLVPILGLNATTVKRYDQSVAICSVITPYKPFLSKNKLRKSFTTIDRRYNLFP